MKFKNKKVLVVGMARSGIAAAGALHKRGARVTICDKKKADELETAIDELKTLDIKICTGCYPAITKDSFDLLVTSPGIPLDIEPFIQAGEQGIPIIGELELAYVVKSDSVDIYAITGTNGKTTTVSLLKDILLAAGKNVQAAGNIGVPLSLVTDSMDEGIVVTEVSSFQLETIRSFRPHISGILNITPDHLDRHHNMEAYIKSKSRIMQYQNEKDYAILNYEDPIIRGFKDQCPAEVIYYSADRILNEGIFIEDNFIKVALSQGSWQICSLKELSLRGKHNLENILCAVAMATAAGADPEAIAHTLRTFPGVRHRMEEVAVKNGVMYINDSKATNPDSAIKALESFNEPLVLIAGGRNKGSSFAVLASLIRKKVKALVLLGEAREQLRQAVMETGFQNIYEAGDLTEAVEQARQLATIGDVVLLSPACASWDMFDNYEQRGDLFCKLVNEIK